MAEALSDKPTESETELLRLLVASPLSDKLKESDADPLRLWAAAVLSDRVMLSVAVDTGETAV